MVPGNLFEFLLLVLLGLCLDVELLGHSLVLCLVEEVTPGGSDIAPILLPPSATHLSLCS
jgi:hypothetical protein